MPREQLLGLAKDVDRLLAAGAPAASGNEGLRRRARTLREMGQKVPALNPIADAVEKVVDASGKQVAPAFLDLVRIVRQVRGNLATVGVEGELKPVEPTGTWKTELSVHELHPIREALAGSGSGREELLRDAMQRKVLNDLRLTSALLNAQDDGHPPVAELVTREALPALGKAVLPDLERSIDLQGKTLDARRLQSICLIDSKVGLEYCRKALEGGSSALKVKALECLPDVAPVAEAEKAAMALIDDKEAEVRAAAIGALRIAKSTEAFEKVLDATRDRSEGVIQAAFNALEGMAYPDTTPRLLAELDNQLNNLTPIPKSVKETKKATTKKPAKTPKKPAKTAAETPEQQKARKARARELNRASRLVQALGGRKDKHSPDAATAIIPLVKHKETDVSIPAVIALGKIGTVTKEVLPTLIETVQAKDRGLSLLAVQAIAEIPPEDRGPAAETIFEVIKTPKGESEDKVRAAIGCLPGFVKKQEKEVLALLNTQLEHKEKWRREAALEACGKIGTSASPLLAEILEAIKKSGTGGGYYYYYYSWRNLAVLTRIDPDGRESIPALLEWLSGKNVGQRTIALRLLGEYGPRAKTAIPLIVPLTEDREYWVKTAAEAALRDIERGE